MLTELAKPNRSAVVVIDLQNDFCHSEGSQAKHGVPCDMAQQAAYNTAAFLNEARKKNVMIIFVKFSHNQWNQSPAYLRKKMETGGPTPCLEGTWGEEFFVVSPQEGEPVVTKHRYSSFIGTNLDLILRSKGIETIILTGVATPVCVESTARDGFMMDYNIILLSDCTGARNMEEHNWSLKILGKHFATVTTAKDLVEAWAASTSQP